MASHLIRAAIANGVYNQDGVSIVGDVVKEYARKRWGVDAAVTKALSGPVNPLLAAGSGLVNETLTRDDFVEAVFSASILGRLSGFVEVPPNVRVNVESAPVTASFLGEYASALAYSGDFEFVATGSRKVGTVAVVSRELLLVTDNAAERVIAGQIQRALSRGIDAAFVGSQAADDVTPAGLGSVAVAAPSFAAGIEAFAGDFSKAFVLLNPATAISLRSPTEQDIKATGGFYSGLPVITSYGVPAGKLFIVDAGRVVAYFGGTQVLVSTDGTLLVDDGTGTKSTTATYLFQTGKCAFKGIQYADWGFVPGAAIEVSLS
jgi:hypothetical protein